MEAIMRMRLITDIRAKKISVPLDENALVGELIDTLSVMNALEHMKQLEMNNIHLVEVSNRESEARICMLFHRLCGYYGIRINSYFIMNSAISCREQQKFLSMQHIFHVKFATVYSHIKLYGKNRFLFSDSAMRPLHSPILRQIIEHGYIICKNEDSIDVTSKPVQKRIPRPFLRDQQQIVVF